MNDFQPIFRGEVFLSSMQASNYEIEAKGLHVGRAGKSALDTQSLLFSPRQTLSHFGKIPTKHSVKSAGLHLIHSYKDLVVLPSTNRKINVFKMTPETQSQNTIDS